MVLSSFLSTDKENLYNADINEIIPGIYLGNVKASQNPLIIQQYKINMVVNCTKDIPFLEWIPYKIRLAINDDSNPTEIQAFQKNIDQVVDYIYNHLASGYSILIHCRAGIQRSASVVSAFLMKYANMNIQQSVKFIKSKRKQAFFGGINFYQALSYYYEQLKFKRKINITQSNSDSFGLSNCYNKSISSYKSDTNHSSKIMDQILVNKNHVNKLNQQIPQNQHVIVNKKIVRYGSKIYNIKV